MLTKKPPRRVVEKTHYNAHVVAWLAELNRIKVEQKKQAKALYDKSYIGPYTERNRERISKNKKAYLKRRKEEDPSLQLAYQRKFKYGISRSEWDALFASQGNCCAICTVTEPGGKSHWHTDHCHDTGKVRGILCHHCNRMLGAARDTRVILSAGMQYLERNQ